MSRAVALPIFIDIAVVWNARTGAAAGAREDEKPLMSLDEILEGRESRHPP